MKENPKSVDIEQLLAEADELIEQIKSDSIKDMEEERIIQFEKHAQELEEIKSRVKDKISKTTTSEILTSAEGVHEAILDILKAMRGMTEDKS
ncbi:MAG: hypothetical protein HQK62_08170 [Desulfamplus sp.]|nr:hypothetical protein [Desulfamplus sp.]MBF0258798.1 hypothetical protein [Desulfamplus sp.]